VVVDDRAVRQRAIVDHVTVDPTCTDIDRPIVRTRTTSRNLVDHPASVGLALRSSGDDHYHPHRDPHHDHRRHHDQLSGSCTPRRHDHHDHHDHNHHDHHDRAIAANLYPWRQG
jgi:hypothetical protein